MKAIFYARVSPTLTSGEFQVEEPHMAEFSLGWRGDVRGYLENLFEELGNPEEIATEYEGAIHNIPDGENYHYIMRDGKPTEIWWASEIRKGY